MTNINNIILLYANIIQIYAIHKSDMGECSPLKLHDPIPNKCVYIDYRLVIKRENNLKFSHLISQ